MSDEEPEDGPRFVIVPSLDDDVCTYHLPERTPALWNVFLTTTGDVKASGVCYEHIEAVLPLIGAGMIAESKTLRGHKR